MLPCRPGRTSIRRGCIERYSPRCSKSRRVRHSPHTRRSTPQLPLVADAFCLRETPKLSCRQQFREAEFVPVRIGDVKEALAPNPVFRRLKLQPLCLQCTVVDVHVIKPKNGSSPPSVLVSRLGTRLTKAWPALRLLNAALSPPYSNSNPSFWYSSTERTMSRTASVTALIALDHPSVFLLPLA